MPEDLSIGEIGRSVVRIEDTLIALAKEVRSEMSDVRHKANNAMAGVSLLNTKSEYQQGDIEHIKASDQRQWDEIGHLKENSASQKAVDQYRKWVIGLFLSLGGLGVVNLIINLAQGGQ